ncbi:MAG: TerD family protein [Pseudonocardia sp.]
MGFGFRVGVPGLGIRVSTRGVRASAGPRIARVSVGSGGTRVSSGLGPFFASTSLNSGGRRATTTRRGTSRARSTGPSPAQLDRARRAAERAQAQAERDTLITELRDLRRRSTSIHLQQFPDAHAPDVPPPPPLGLAWATAEAQAFHLRGIGRFARSERAAARLAAARDAETYLAAEQARLSRIHHDLGREAANWWQAMLANDEQTVCEAVNSAFADNPAAGCAVGIENGVLSVVLRQQDIDTLPDQTPALTSAGRPTLKTLTKRDRALWWLTIMGSNVLATVNEALATAPAVDAVDLAVLSRIPDTQRLGVVAHGRWTRSTLAAATLRTPEDALRFLDLGVDVTCSATTSSTRIQAIDTSQHPGLQTLVDTAIDDGLDDHPAEPAPDQPSPYAIVPFSRWTAEPPPSPPSPTRAQPLAPGQNLVLPDDAEFDLTLDFRFAGADADLTLLLLGVDGHVRSDADFAFYNQPVTAQGAARLLGKSPQGTHTVERASVRLAALSHDVHRIVVSINMDVDAGLTCAALEDAALHITAPTASWTIPTPADPQIRAMVLAELYRHTRDAQPVWKLRAVGQGWADGLAGLARAHGVDIN